MGHTPSPALAASLRAGLLQLLPRMSASELANGLWAAAAVGLLDVGLFQAAAEALAEAPGVTAEGLQQVCANVCVWARVRAGKHACGRAPCAMQQP